MARHVFFSFHFDNDYWRTQQVRNIGVIEGNKPVSANDWEEVKKKGDSAIEKWIDDNLFGKSCTIVLVGEETSTRKWVKKEIEKTWNNEKGLLGIYIHNLKHKDGTQAKKGENPFENFTIGENKKKLSSIVKCYYPPYIDSQKVYNYIAENIEDWVENAIKIRENY